MSDGSKDWYGLGPVSVLPKNQRQWIGKALIEKGISMMEDLNAEGIALVGEPNYYKRYGFKNYPELMHEDIPQEVFLLLPFTEKIPMGTIEFHKAFQATK